METRRKLGRSLRTPSAVESLNRRLRKLRKRARKAAAGIGGRKSREALRRLGLVEGQGLAARCCGKSAEMPCRCCPRHAAELLLAPLSEHPTLLR